MGSAERDLVMHTTEIRLSVTQKLIQGERGPNLTPDYLALLSAGRTRLLDDHEQMAFHNRKEIGST